MSGGFRPVTAAEPCPACGHHDWCAWTPDRWLKCERSTTPPAGMRLAKPKDGGALFAPADERRFCVPPPAPASSRKAAPARDWTAEHERCSAAATDERVRWIAAELCVTAEALRSLGIGWCSRDDLHRWKASGAGWKDSFPDGAFSFPERDGDGRVIGLALRAQDGRKGSPTGSARGLTIPDGLAEWPDPVLVVEGASDVASLDSIGVACVGRPSNTGGVDHLARFLEPRDVLVLGENDAKPNGESPGRDGARAVALRLAAKWRRPVRWSMPPAGFKDVRAWLKARVQAGMDLADPAAWNTARVDLLAALEAGIEIVTPETTPQPIRPGASVGFVSSQERQDTSTEPAWPEPQELPDALPAVAPFDFDLIPTALRGWVQDVADRQQCPPDYLGVAVMVTLAAIVGRKVGIRPKRHDDWLVVPNLYGMVVGRPGVMKSPALAEPLRILRTFEREARERFEAEQGQHEVQAIIEKEKRSEIQRRTKEALANGRDPKEALAELDTLTLEPPPARARFVLNDATVEKLGEVLAQNPNGLLLFRDELVGLLASLDREGQEGGRAFLLECWDGTGSFVFDRISRGTVDVPAAILSVLGGTQPGPLQRYLVATTKGPAGDDGLLQRFQLAVWPDVSGAWRNVDRAPDVTACRRAEATYRRLERLDAAAIGAEREDADPRAIPFLRFAPAAQEGFDAWRARLEHRLRNEDEHPAIVSHLAKYRKLVPALALLSHVADGRTGPVDEAALGAALRWATYLETHAARIYSVASRPDLVAARELAKKIVTGKLADGFTLRDVYHADWTGLTNRDEAQRAADVLVEADWLREIREETGGRPRVRFRINPRASKSRLTRTPKTPKSPPDPLLGVLGVRGPAHSDTSEAEGDEQETAEWTV